MKKSISLDNLKKTKDTAKYVILIFLCLSFCVLLTLYAPQSKTGVSSALNVCSNTVIPSLFPFMFLSGFMTESGIFSKKIKFINSVSEFVFKLPQCAFGVMVISALGGYPVGGKMTKQLFENGYLTQNQAQRLLLFCVNPGPAFTISVIGLSFFKNIKLGYIVYFSVLISNFIIGLLSRFISDNEVAADLTQKEYDLYSAFVRSGSSAATAIISVCTFIVIFSCLENVVSAFIDNKTVTDVLSGTLEVTTGCERLAGFSDLPLISGVTAWGGVSVHCQISDCIKKIGLDLKLFLSSRIICAGLSAVICDLLLKMFPTEINVFSPSGSVLSATSETSFPISVALLLTCCVFLIGDYSFNSKHKC